MSQQGIFYIGVGISLLCALGLFFTITEMRRLGREADNRAVRQ